MNSTSTAATSIGNAAGARRDYEREGFLIAPQVIPSELISRVRRRMDAVYAGEYETGVAPAGNPVRSSAPPRSLVKIDNAHRSDRTILELVSHPALGALAAAITGAKFVQVFATQMLIKPPASGGRVNVGWHQDQEYWEPALEGELFTAWIAVSDVTAESGPMRFVRGSHRWGLLKAGDFFSDNLDSLKQTIRARQGGDAWEEVPAILPPGGVSFHHRLTVHGSGPNFGAGPRLSFAVHLRTEKSGLRAGTRFEDAGYLNDFNDPIGSPLCHGRL
jgi:ectoine hydroxylase-related dioxygenase (phytanoyl-CoA dioxygenase family)